MAPCIPSGTLTNQTFFQFLLSLRGRLKFCSCWQWILWPIWMSILGSMLVRVWNQQKPMESTGVPRYPGTLLNALPQELKVLLHRDY